LFYYAFRQIFIPCFLNIHPNRKTYREFEGRLFTRKEISDQVGGKDWVLKEHTIDVHISNIRKVIGDNFIQTIKGEGYKFLQL
ncbi:MAG: winged helix-turn-helix domain-containing protein, partial [Bacteroidia bacterium]